jgi:RNA polymerase sigma-B factor
MIDDTRSNVATVVGPRVTALTRRALKGGRGFGLMVGDHDASACDTQALLSRWREDRDRAAREELVARFLPLARRLAGRYLGSCEPLDDLVQVASLGLLGAIDRFNPARGVPFRAFVVPSIIGELKHYYRSTGWAMHVSPDAQELALRVNRVSREITARSGRPARIAELAEHLEITTEDVLTAIATATAHYSISLDAAAAAHGDDEHGAVADSIGAEDRNYADLETALSVSAAVLTLPERQRQALTLRLDRAMTETEIARRLNCSQMQVSRLLHRAAAGLQELLDPPLGELEQSAVGRESTHRAA